MGNDQREFPVIRWQWQSELQSIPRSIVRRVDIMVEESKIRIDQAQIFLAPFDESFVDIDPYIAAWLRILLEELPRHSAAAAPEISRTFQEECRILHRSGCRWD